MKTIKFLAILTILIFAACDNNDENKFPEEEYQNLVGTWVCINDSLETVTFKANHDMVFTINTILSEEKWSLTTRCYYFYNTYRFAWVSGYVESFDNDNLVLVFNGESTMKKKYIKL